MTHLIPVIVLLAMPAFSSVVLAESAIDFSRDVYPILRRSCFECHGNDKQESGLRLDDKSAVFESMVIHAGRPDSSELVRRIEFPRGHDEVMPSIGDLLSPREISAIRRWIAAGAPWPDDFVEPPHWAYVAPFDTPAPEVSDPNWCRNPIDRFVLARLDELDLDPSRPADDAVLLRRLHLDLVGLPPTLAEVQAFEADQSHDPIERVVDDLLARPQFGERWARPWLDVARYADSHGFQRDDFRDLWAYRDWVIGAFNQDMPFDQFTIEQLAGDLLPNPTESQLIATGFHRCAPTNVEAGSLPEETRIEQVIDRVNTTAAVWLGSTLECAQCHDHKYDPFTSADYYRFLAFFNNTELEADRVNPKQPSSIAFKGPSIPLSSDTLDHQRRELQEIRNSLDLARQARRVELQSDLAAWATKLAEQVQYSPREHVIDVESFESRGNTDTYELRDDGAILLVGSDPPATDTYVVDGKISVPSLSAIRLDCLTDPSLPGNGPGRGSPMSANFVLNDFAVAMVIPDGSETKLTFASARADFSQNRWDVMGAIDDVKKSGWAIAPQFGKPHWATFVLEQPIDAPAGIHLRFRLSQQFGNARNIGCFKLSGITGDVGAESIPTQVAEIVTMPADSWTNEHRGVLIDHRELTDGNSQSIQSELLANTQSLANLAPDTTQVMVELKTPRPAYVFMRGDYRTPGESVTAATPGFLHRGPQANASRSPLDRLDLARWLVDPANPLVARAAVNRYWLELFGDGLVRTPEDFGLKGDSPTHPELLDWMAVDLVRNGWSVKRLLKTIVTSSTYQQSSAMSDKLRQLDDQNRLLARGPRVRMDAEMIRDNSLAVSDLLSRRLFGPPIRPYQPPGIWSKVGGQNYSYEVSPGGDAYRRGVYVVIKRGAPYPSFVNFDADNRFTCTVQRSRSNTPLQALTLLNDPVYVEVAKAVAIRAARNAKHQSLNSTITDELRRTVARAPSSSEVAALASLYDASIESIRKNPERAKQLASDVLLPAEVSESEFAAWYSVATVILNLHETITKE